VKFLADQNVEHPIIRRLLEAGHEVAAVTDEMPHQPDREVLAAAERRGLVLITNDKDFAELAFLQRRARQGIVLLRMPSASSSEKADRLLEVVTALDERLRGAMTVVGEDAARRRVFPRDPLLPERDDSA
jgi:predicted nuclease of predicted toxin-antitoxin system